MNKKIRVAFWHNVFAPYRVPLFQKLAAFDDIDLTVYYGAIKDRHRKWSVDFGEGYKYVLLPHLSIPFYPHKFNPTLFHTLVKENYDVFIAPENELGCQISYLAAKWMKKPLIVWSVQIDYQIIRDNREYTFRGCLQKLFPFIGRKIHSLVFYLFHFGAVYTKRHADAWLAAGLHTEKYLAQIGAEGPFFRFGNAIDSESLQQKLQKQDPVLIKQSLGIEENKKVILALSYLQKRKGIQYLIEAFLQLNRNDSVLLIVGDGDYKQELLKLIPEHRNDILFAGYDEETAKYYAIADMFAMPSFSDPWGLTINEAMVAGLPVITTSNVGARELIRGNGFVIPPRDSQRLKDALELLLNDNRMRHGMGKRSFEIIQDYTIEHAAEVCRTAIHSVVETSSSMYIIV